MCKKKEKEKKVDHAKAKPFFPKPNTPTKKQITKTGSKSAMRPPTRPSSSSPAPGRSSTAAMARSATRRGPSASAAPASSARRRSWVRGRLFPTRASRSCGRPRGRCGGRTRSWKWRRRKRWKWKKRRVRRRRKRERRETKTTRRKNLLFSFPDDGSNRGSSGRSAERLRTRGRSRSAQSSTS